MTETCKISFKCVIIFKEKECKAKKELKNQAGKFNYWEETGVILYYIQDLTRKYTQECCEISKANPYGFMIT